MTASASAWCFATPEDRQWWGEMQADRVVGSRIGELALSAGLSDRAGLHQMAEAWRAWAQHDDGWFAVLHGELLCRVPEAA